MKKYEYKILTKGLPAAFQEKSLRKMTQDIEKDMNALGAEGWEFVQWKQSMLIFKRVIEEVK